MNALTEIGLGFLTAVIALGAMFACFACGIPGLGAAIIGFLLAVFALEYTFSTAYGFLPTVIVAGVCALWSLLGILGLYLGALHWL